MNELQIAPIRHGGVALYPPGATFGPRRLRDWEFVWMIEGDALYSSDGHRVEAPEGSIVLCRPGTTDSFRWDVKHPTRHGYFHFNVEAWPSHWPAVQNWPLVREPREDDVLRPLFRHVLAWMERGDELQRRLMVASLLSAFVTAQSEASEVAREPLPPGVEAALEWLRATLEREPHASIRLDEIARAACLSPEHLCRVFKSSTGHSPLETVRLMRLDRAATLLARSNYSVAEIARLCGFASAFHFSRRFKDAFGCSPREARRRAASEPGLLLPRLGRYPTHAAQKGNSEASQRASE